MMVYFIVSIRCTSTVTNNSIIFSCTSSIDSARYSITLDHSNMMDSTVIGMALSFSNLNAATEYNYTAILIDSDLQTTLVTPTSKY